MMAISTDLAWLLKPCLSDRSVLHQTFPSSSLFTYIIDCRCSSTHRIRSGRAWRRCLELATTKFDSGVLRGMSCHHARCQMARCLRRRRLRLHFLRLCPRIGWRTTRERILILPPRLTTTILIEICAMLISRRQSYYTRPPMRTFSIISRPSIRFLPTILCARHWTHVSACRLVFVACSAFPHVIFPFIRHAAQARQEHRYRSFNSPLCGLAASSLAARSRANDVSLPSFSLLIHAHT